MIQQACGKDYEPSSVELLLQERQNVTERRIEVRVTYANRCAQHMSGLLCSTVLANQSIAAFLRRTSGGCTIVSCFERLFILAFVVSRLDLHVGLLQADIQTFNFVGKLLGPKGNSMKRLQEDTMTKMAVLGRGSMKDKQKEEEMRASLDPKYAHLSDDLHVEIAAFAPPAEAHARIAYALAELRKYLIPDANDEIRQEQMREMELIQTDPSVGVVGPNGTAQIGVRKPIRGGMRGRGGVGLRGAPALRGGGIPSLRGGGRGLLSPPGSLLPPRGGVPPSGVRKPMPPPQALLPRPIPTKTKVLSILDRARVAMEESYAMGEDDMGGGGFYDSSYNSYNATG
uniref:KHDC4/BBP-like KH-domain type I domain-containing protein n=1 Tax=Timema monikensis TaxID=170555 RepID=A0A7R9E5X2_9NEOP|nr:unnamed protein product [Timema monikensis]